MAHRTTVHALVERGLLSIGDGYRVRNVELGPEGIPFVRGGDIGDGWIDTHTADRIRPEFAERVRGKLSRPGDVAFIVKGSVGRVGFFSPDSPPVVVAPQVSIWRSLDRGALDPRFLYYMLRGPEFQASLHAVKTHGSMLADYVSLRQQLDFDVTIPEADAQRAIASVLGSLDDKIDLNRRMNATLEATTRAIFKAWFVDFEALPVEAGRREPVAMVAERAAVYRSTSAAGSLPSGWREGSLGDVATNPRRGVGADEIAPLTAYIGLEHMPRRSIALSDWGTSDGLASNKFAFRAGEILFGKLRPYFHKVGVAPVDGVCSTDILVVSPVRPEWEGFVLGHVSSDEFVAYTDASSAGTKMPRTNWGDMVRYPVALPPPEAAGRYTEMIRPMINRIISNIHEARTLAALRDCLLPKLLSGEIRVKDIA